MDKEQREKIIFLLYRAYRVVLFLKNPVLAFNFSLFSKKQVHNKNIGISLPYLP